MTHSFYITAAYCLTFFSLAGIITRSVLLYRQQCRQRDALLKLLDDVTEQG